MTDCLSDFDPNSNYAEHERALTTRFFIEIQSNGQCDQMASLLFLIGPTRPLFVYFRSFQTQFFRKIIDFSWIRTRIVGIEGKHADQRGPMARLFAQYLAFSQKLKFV